MSFTLNDLQTSADTTDDGFNSESFKVVLESHLNYLRIHTSTVVLSMEGLEHVVYRGSLDGWLFSKNIKEKYHWIIARMNGLVSCSDYSGKKKSFLIPDLNILDGLLSVHRSIKN